MIDLLMRLIRRRQHDTNGHAQNGNGQPPRAQKSDAEIERRMAEEARRYENDLRRLAKT